jgi:hypothetical protein
MNAPEWFLDFIARHTGRCPCPGKWPAMIGGQPTQAWIDLFEPWGVEFVRRNVTSDVADRASAMMSAKSFPPPGAKHLEALMGYVQQVWEIGATEADVPKTREEAERRSRDCPECAGSGMTTRKYATTYMPRSMSETNRNVAWFCLCPAGEFLATCHRDEKSPLRHTRRLAQYPELWDNRWGVHPCWPQLPVPRSWAMEPCWDRYQFDGPENDPANMPIYRHSREALKLIGMDGTQRPVDVPF